MGFLALRIDVNIPNLDPKPRFQPQLSADGDVVRSDLQRDGADATKRAHRGVERSGRWDVHLRRLVRQQPSPRCCGSGGEVHRSERREFARFERGLFTRSDRRHVKDFVKRVGVHAKTLASV